MRNFKRLSVLVIFLCSFFFLAWNPLKPVFNFFAAAFSGGETNIPLPLPSIQVGITGKPTFSLNVQVPPGAGDVVPEISISYTGGLGQSILGKGWALGGFPRIFKNPNLGVHFGASDGFSSSLFGDLLPTSTNGVYRSKMESFNKIISDGTAWVVRDKSGITYEYGRNNNAGSGSIVASDDGQPITFYLDKVRDSFGNGYDIVYNTDTSISDEPLPQEIKYARGNGRIEFTYAARSNGFKEQLFYLTKAILRKNLLSKVQVYAKDSNGSEQLTETYEFEYDTTDLGPILSSFERVNYKPIVFSYSERSVQSNIFSSGSKNYDISFRATDPTVQAACQSTQIACACTANWACIIASGYTAPILCAAGMGTYQDICANGVITSFVTPADTDGDGAPELVRVLGTMTNQKFSVSKLSDWETATSNPIAATNTSVGEHIGITSLGRILPGDFNGDGKTDFLILKNNGDTLKVYYGPDFRSESYSTVTVQGLGASVSKHFVMDANSDGKTDFLQADASNILTVYTSTGSGFQKLQTLTIPTYGTEFQQFVDMDQNGVPDYVRINGTTSKDLMVTFLDLKNGLLQIIDSSTLTRTSFGKSGDQFLTDLNGDGYLDFAFFAISGSQGTISYYPFTGRTFLANGGSPFQTINVNGAYANQIPGSTKSTTYVDVDLSGDGVKDRVSYNNTDVSNSFFNVEIYDVTQSEYLTAFKAPWNTDVSRDLNGDGSLDILRADTSSTQQTDSNGVTTTVSVTKFKITITNGSYYEAAIDLNSYISTATASAGDSSSMAYSNWRNRKDFLDLNGDGKADFLRYDASDSLLSVSYAKSDSNGYITYSANGDDSWTTGGYFLAADANADGKPEIIGLKGDKVDFQTATPSSAPGLMTKVFRTFPYESSLELHYIRFNQAVPSGLLTGIQNGVTASTGDLKLGIDYQLSRTHSGANRADLYNSSTPQFVPVTGADYLATSVWQKTGSNILSSQNYQFSFARFYLNGIRNSSYIGFQTIKQTDSISNSLTETTYEPTFLEMAGVPTSQTQYKNGIKIAESSGTFAKSNSIFGSLLVLPTGKSDTRYSNGDLLSSTFVTQTFDSYGNVLTKNTTVNGTLIAENTTYLNDWNAGVLGKPTEIQVLKNGEIISDKKFNYSNFLVSEVKELVSAGVWRSQFIQAYDQYGNPTAVQDSNGNTSTIEYEQVAHKYPAKTVNSLGHITLKSYDLTNGLELSSTDPNGGVSRTEYDTFGRAVLSYMPGESDWSEKIEYVSTGDLENQLVRKTFRRSEGESWQEESSNILTGLSKKRSSLVNSYVLVEEMNKNREGQTIKKVDSYLEGSNPFTWTNYTYDPEGNLTKSERNDGSSVLVTRDGLNTTTQELVNGNVIKETLEVKNSLGQTASLTQQGKTIQYKYATNGKVSQIIDPENGNTSFVTDLAGRQTKVTSPNSGTVEYSFDPNSGNLQEQRLANGSKVNYTYDTLGRVIQVQGTGAQGETASYVYEYDSPSTSNGIGRVSKVTDPLGTTVFEYDIRGNQSVIKKHLTDEDLTFIIQKTYNLQNQISQVVYPDGSIVKNLYSEAGYLSGVTLTPGDGSGTDFPVAQYDGPILEDGLLKIQRILGNGVISNIYYDPIKRRPVHLKTGKDSDVYQETEYTYDDSGNYSSILDKKNPVRNQSFAYDSINRLVSATGAYGTEEYQYSDSGKLLSKGNLTYSYADSSHKNAVTQVVGQNVTYNYSYDSLGNVINRNGDTISYDPFQKLKRIDTENQETVRFDYDFTGTRIRKTRTSDGTKTITLGGLYEVVLASGKSPQHTLYFRGNSGDLVGQWSRTDATLVSSVDSSASEVSGPTAAWNTFLWKSKDNTIRGIKYLFFVPGTNLAFLYITLFLAMRLGLLSYQEGAWKAVLKFTTPVLLVAFSNCSVLMPGGNGTPPWALLPIIDGGTPGVGNPYGPGSGAGIPVSGFLFLHPDHLGSITMATDGNGNRIAGGDQGGASHISYKPYGEIDRTDSFGPDTFRYKYTGQEEDRETGLYYYKARYYDPILGRFLQADSVINGSNPMGMDVYMYTEGNPISYTDPSGHSTFSAFLKKNGLDFLNFNIVASGTLQKAFYLSGQRANAAAAVVGALNPVGLGLAGIGLGIGAALGASSLAIMAGATMLGAAVGAGIAGVGLGTAALGIAGATALGAGTVGLVVGAGTLGQISAIGAVAAVLGVGVGMLAVSVAMFAAGAAIIAGLFVLAVASLIVMTVLVTALAVALVAIAAVPGLLATGLYLGAAAIGSVFSPWTLQGYIAGGYSKSSLNDLRWNEKDARTSACYVAAGQFAGMIVGAIAFQAPWLLTGITEVAPTPGIQTDIVAGIKYFGYASLAYDLIQKDWGSAVAGLVGLRFPGTGAVYSGGKIIHNSCGGTF